MSVRRTRSADIHSAMNATAIAAQLEGEGIERPAFTAVAAGARYESVTWGRQG
jgi:hypothetical protein